MGTEAGPFRQLAIFTAITKASNGLYGSSEVQALFSVSDGESRLVSGGVLVNAETRLAVRDPHTGAKLPAGEGPCLWPHAGPSPIADGLPEAAARFVACRSRISRRAVTRCRPAYIGRWLRP
jgi:hypothetical protein